MSMWSTLGAQHKSLQGNLEKTCKAMEFLTGIFDQFYRIEEKYMKDLQRLYETNQKLFDSLDYFSAPATNGFYRKGKHQLNSDSNVE